MRTIYNCPQTLRVRSSWGICCHAGACVSRERQRRLLTRAAAPTLPTSAVQEKSSDFFKDGETEASVVLRLPRVPAVSWLSHPQSPSVEAEEEDLTYQR